MSQHRIDVTNDAGVLFHVMMGYDRRLDYVFCHVETGEESESEEDTYPYSSIDHADAFDMKDVRKFAAPLAALGLTIPESVYAEIESDQANQVGNRVVFYNSDGTICGEHA